MNTLQDDLDILCSFVTAISKLGDTQESDIVIFRKSIIKDEC
jgi:hypothetical protein